MSNITLNNFKNSLDWYSYLQEKHDNPLNYNTVFNVFNARSTNWSTFNYDQIQFDGSAPYALMTPCLATFRVNVITFSKNDSEKILKTSIIVPFEALGLLKKLEHETRLFVYECQPHKEDKIKRLYIERLARAISCKHPYAATLRQWLQHFDLKRNTTTYNLNDSLLKALSNTVTIMKGNQKQRHQMTTSMSKPAATLNRSPIQSLTQQINSVADEAPITANDLKIFCSNLLEPCYLSSGDVIYRLHRQFRREAYGKQSTANQVRSMHQSNNASAIDNTSRGFGTHCG